VKLGDGFTFTMPDTPKNQAQYPQAKTQKPSVGQPIARACTIVSLANICVASRRRWCAANCGRRCSPIT
jgi:putative transposase